MNIFIQFKLSRFINFLFFLDLDETKFRKNTAKIRSERGISLFEPIPSTRSCSDALIPDAFCSCFRQENISEVEFEMDTTESFKSTAGFILAQINHLTDSVRAKCHQFRLERIVSFKKLVINRIKMYAVVLVSQPGDAWFEASLKLEENKRKGQFGRLKLNGDPIRLSAYGNQSHCIKHPTLVNFCFCNDLI